MNYFSIITLGLTGAFLAVIVKQTRPEFALLISIACGGIVFLFILDELNELVLWWQELGAVYGSLTSYLAPLIKILGVAYMTQFVSQACKDAGETAIASKLELTGKVVILGLTVPMVKMVLETIQELLS